MMFRGGAGDGGRKMRRANDQRQRTKTESRRRGHNGSLLATPTSYCTCNSNSNSRARTDTVGTASTIAIMSQEDPLQWRPAGAPVPQDSSPAGTHMKTYTAGEDAGRLKAAAKELGLAQARKPRRQVRKEKRLSALHLPQVLHVLLDSSTEDARMRAIYSSHQRLTDEERRMFHVSLPGHAMDTLVEEGEDEEEGFIDDGHGPIGGDLVSAVLGIIKGMVGPAILYLPHGFATSGYVIALPMLVVCTTFFLYSSSCLLQTWKHESTRGLAPEGAFLLKSTAPRRQMLSYPELAYRALGARGEALVKAGIALMQSGVCLTYLIFVPQNLHASFALLTGLEVSTSLWLLLMIGVQIPLSWIRDIRKLTPTNLLANCLILYGLLTCIGFAIKEATAPTHNLEGPVEEFVYHVKHLKPVAGDWFLFIGTSVLLFEGTITLLVPLQEAVVLEEERAKFPAVFQRVILSIISFYMFFGLINWAAYGQEVRTVLTTCLPPGVLATTVQLAYSVAVIFTFPLQNFPALEIATRSIATSVAKCTKPGSIWTKRNVLSSLLVALLAIVALATMDSLDKVVSLMGSLLGCPIAFIFPPLIQIQLMPEISATRRGCNYFVMFMGVVAMVLASVTTILTW